MAEAFDHDALRELVALHAIGALQGDERAAVESHVAGCAECAAELRAYAGVGMALAQVVPQVDPPASLRAAILESARRDRLPAQIAAPTASRSLAPWLAAAAMLAIAVGTALYAATLQRRLRALEGELRDALLRVDDGERRVQVALRSASAAQTSLSVLTAADVRRIDLAGQPVAPSAAARAFWSRSRGLVITASNLPALPPGRIYQLWFVTAQAPISAGLLTPDATGGLTTALSTPPDLPNPVALAVTLEPEGGVPAPTGDKYLVGATQ